MRARWPLVTMVLGIGAAYVAYPYATLYRLGSAIQTADAATLESLVDWPAVREGIKEDVCDFSAAEAGPAKNGSELAPFGASFIRGIMSNSIDKAVTPQALLAAATTTPPAKLLPRRSHGADVHINWAFFDSPTSFLVSLKAHDQSEPIKVEMDLRNGEWLVMRVWLPQEMLSPGAPT